MTTCLFFTLKLKAPYGTGKIENAQKMSICVGFLAQHFWQQACYTNGILQYIPTAIGVNQNAKISATKLKKLDKKFQRSVKSGAIYEEFPRKKQ